MYLTNIQQPHYLFIFVQAAGTAPGHHMGIKQGTSILYNVEHWLSQIHLKRF